MSKLPNPTKKRLASIARALESGASRADAASDAGIDPDHLTEWLRRAKAGDSDFRLVPGQIVRAEARARIRAAEGVIAAAADDWRAAAWFLERRDPDEWSKGGARVDLSKFIAIEDVAELLRELNELIREVVHDTEARTPIMHGLHRMAQQVKARRAG